MHGRGVPLNPRAPTDAIAYRLLNYRLLNYRLLNYRAPIETMSWNASSLTW